MGLEQSAEDRRNRAGTLSVESTFQDLRFALRMLRKSPGFTVAVVFALALGIGANTAIFSVINAVLLSPLPLKVLKDPDRLVMIWEKNPALNFFLAGHIPVRLRNYRAWKQQARSFEGMAIFNGQTFNLTDKADAGGRRPEQVAGAVASSNFLPLLGMSPRLGRNFTAEEMQPYKGQVVIVADQLYQSRFHDDPHILGKMLYADGREYRVVGVLPKDFELPAAGGGFDQSKPQMLVPVNMRPGSQAEQQLSYLVYARLRPGITLQQARGEMAVLAKRLEKADPDLNTGFGANVFPLRLEDVGADLRHDLLVLQIAVVFVLLIACANVGNLLLTRAVKREKEIAVRIAIGASRFRLIRQMLTESLLLSLFSAAVGLLMAFWALRVISFFAPPDTHGFHELRIDPTVLLFTVLVALAAGLLFGLAPSLHAVGHNLNEALGRSARSVSGSSNRVRSALVISEVALSLILLVGAGLMIRSLASVMSTDLGFRLDHLLTLQVTLPASKYPKPEQMASFNRRLLEAVRRIPGIKQAALTTGLPMRSISESSYEIEGRPTRNGKYLVADWARVSDGYFETLRMKMLKGRTFTRREALANPPRVAVVNEAFARANWPHQDPLGKVVIFGGEQGKNLHYAVIGIVGNEYQMGPELGGKGQFYVPGRQLQTIILVARTAGKPLALASAVENQIWNIDKEQPVSNVESMDGVLHEWTAPRRFNMTILLNFAALALLLAAVGLYSVLAYSVSLRTREIGIRMALGAEPKNVAGFVLGQGFKFTLIGIAIGLAGAFALTRFMQSLIFGVSATDPYTFLLVAILMITVSLAASYFPARQATRIDPTEALRAE